MTDRKIGGSELCVACGLCCNGALHTSVTVRPEHVRLVRKLGLTIEKTDDDEVGFRQPCPLHQKNRCSAYPHHPPTCQQYRCALLQKYEDGDVTLEDSLAIARTAKELLAGGAERLAVGAVSGQSLRFELAQSWDSEHGLLGAGARRRANAELVLRAATLDVHLEKHFRLPRKASHGLLESPRVKASDPVLQLTSRGVAPTALASMTALCEEFRAHRCVRVTSFIEPRLLSRIQQQIADAAFADRVHGTIATELCMQRNACLGLLHFLVNDPSVFRFVEQVSGCHGLTSFLGRVYRMRADLGHYDAWHDDVRPDRQVGMSVNLGTEPYEGGVFEIRRADSAEPLAVLANVGSGDAILFSIADDLEHRVTPMRGPVAKTAFAGWFGGTRDYRDVVHQRTQAS